MLNIKKYHDKRKVRKKLVFIDPSVYELVKLNEYSHLAEMETLIENKQLLGNEWISIDYPCDMNPQFSVEFIEKSIRNNLRWKENQQYICTVQSRFQDYGDFVKQYEYLEQQIDFSKKIIGIGNMCRILQPTTFSDRVFRYLRSKQSKLRWIHFYGLALSLIRKYLPGMDQCIISMDSTKWTRACTSDLKQRYGLNCNSKNRDEFFMAYTKIIQDILTVPSINNRRVNEY